MRVPGIGPLDCKLAIVGEAPGAEEAARGLPFIGSSGHELDRMLSKCGVNRSSCYITNVVKDKPANNDFSALYCGDTAKERGKRKEPTDELKAAWTELAAELTKSKANLILCLGAESTRALLGTKGIDQHRGFLHKWQDSARRTRKLIATHHPARVLRQYELHPIAVRDIAKAHRLSQSPDFPQFDYSFFLAPSHDTVVSVLRGLISKRLGRRIAFDIETTGEHVRCLGLAWSSRHALVIPFTRRGKLELTSGEPRLENYWSEQEETAILRLLDELFRSSDLDFIAQNYPFDSTILAQDFGLYVENLSCDTLLLSHSCYSELPKSLDFLTSIHTDLHHYSNYDAANDRSTWEYNAYDCCVTFEVAEKLEAEASEFGVLDHYRKIVLPAMLALTRTQNRGIRMNLSFRFARSQSTHHEENDEVAKLPAVSAKSEGSLNPFSPAQVATHLYETLALPIQRKRDGKVTTDDEALEKLIAKFPQHSEVLGRILRCRGLRKLRTTYLESKLTPDNRITCSFNVSGTVNGRISSGKTIFGIGGNLQNVPPDARPMFLPEEGHTWIKVDLRQAESMVVTWEAPIPSLQERFLDEPDFDIHRWNAVNIFGGDKVDITKDQRSIAKAGVHGGNYGLGTRKAASIYKLSYTNAKRAIEAYRRALPEIEQWWIRVQSEIGSTRRLRNPFGRQRVFFGRPGDDLYRSAYSFIPQSTVADVINLIYSRAEAALSSLGGFPLLQVHDEIDFSVPSGSVAQALPIIRELFNVPIEFESTARPLVIPIEIAIGKDWFNLEEVSA